MITSKVTQNTTGQTLTSWIDPATGNRRLVLTNASGAPEVAEGIVIHGAKATVTTVDYAAHTATTGIEPTATIRSDARLGVNVPSPSDIRSELRSATLVSEGQAVVDGHHTYRMRMTVPPGSQHWFPGDDVELYVDTSTYQLVRTTISHNGTLQDTDDLTWAPRTAADLKPDPGGHHPARLHQPLDREPRRWRPACDGPPARALFSGAGFTDELRELEARRLLPQCRRPSRAWRTSGPTRAAQPLEVRPNHLAGEGLPYPALPHLRAATTRSLKIAPRPTS